MSLGIWRNASAKRKRILSTIIMFIIALVVTVAGSLMPVDLQQARQINNELNQTVTAAQQNGTLVQSIFSNNFLITLIMFVPVFGPGFGFYVLFSTGAAINAIAIAQGYPLFLVLFSLVLTPVFWLEFVVYSTALAESIWLFRRILQGRGLRELKNLGILVAVCAGLLFLGAVIEAWLISIGI
jgi:hypothetical protein